MRAGVDDGDGTMSRGSSKSGLHRGTNHGYFKLAFHLTHTTGD